MTTELETPTQPTTDRLRDQVGTVRDDLKTLGGLAKDAAQEKLGEARTAARDAYHHGRERVDTELDRFARRVQENPLQSIAIAAGIGVLLGALLSRRH
jgi:ElaB/YqjD/DUF883 family membrane-anchored ribosome-binding protein